MLRTTPTTMLSALYLMVNSASNAPRRAPAIGAPINPAHDEPKIEAVTAPANAPNRSWPSIAMLTMPARSLMTPESAPNTRGVANIKPPARSDTTGSTAEGRPATARTRKPITKAVPTTTRNQPGTGLRSMASLKVIAANTRPMIAMIQIVNGALTVTVPMANQLVAPPNEIFDSPFAAIAMMTVVSAISALTTGSRQEIGRTMSAETPVRSSDFDGVVATVLTPQLLPSVLTYPSLARVFLQPSPRFVL